MAPEPGSCPNVFEAVVEELIYLGDHVRSRLRLLGNDEFIVKVPNSGMHRPMEVGETGQGGLERGGLPGPGFAAVLAPNQLNPINANRRRFSCTEKR